MTTVIKATGAFFSSENLPYINELVTDGLRAAFRLYGSNPLTDLSGNNTTLTPVGTPTYVATGVKGDRSNGFKSNLLETESMTITSIFNVAAEDENTAGFAVSCFTEALGFSLYHRKPTDTNILSMLVHVKNTSTGVAFNFTSDLEDVAVVNPLFIALSVDAATNKITVFVPKLNIKREFTPPAGHTIAGRTLSATPIAILTNPAGTRPTWLNKTTMSELLIYNKVLTDEQITEQYNYSKSKTLAALGLSV